jgi:hypothetical protein
MLFGIHTAKSGELPFYDWAGVGDRGIVRLNWRELADQERSCFSRGKPRPFGESGGAVLLENFAAVEVTAVVEMVVDRGVDGGEFLQGLDVPEFRHRSLSSSKRLV